MNAGACNEPRQGSLSHCLPSSRICNPSARSPASDSADIKVRGPDISLGWHPTPESGHL